jgi:signal-transduction protein with cAMP-binding, CBS, and nucleotidyltransferase domain
MLSIERVKELLNDPNLSDKEVEEIRDGFRMLSEVVFEQWQAERMKAKAKKDDEKKDKPVSPKS